MIIKDIITFIKFRNAHSIAPVIIQCFMLLSACLIIAGLLYVIVLVFAITIYHVLFDRDAKRIPSYVTGSMQFDSDSDESDEIAGGTSSKDHKNSSKGRLNSDGRMGGYYPYEDDEEFDEFAKKKKSHAEISMAARRLANLDKFMRQEIDVKKI